MASISSSGSLSSISGLASGVQWSDLIDQIIKLESSRQLDPLNSQITAKQQQQRAWQDYQSVLVKLTDAARALRDGTAFTALKTTVGNSPTSGRALLTASASASAAPGAFKVEVQDIARAEKVAGGVYASATTALGVSGDFVVNGKHVDITAADTLSSIRDKINALNVGSSPTQVTATILSTSSTANRLVLTSDATGANGIELTDGAAGALSQLGFLDSTRTANTKPDGSAQSNRFSVTTTAIATLLGVTMPPPQTTIKVNGQSVHVNLSTDSLSYIASLVRAAGASAETVAETSNGVTSYRLVVGGTVTADPADAANSQRALELLGFQQAGRGAEAQSAVTNAVLQDAAGSTATASTLLTDLKVAGASAGVQAGDTFTIRGTRGDGTAVSLSYQVQAGDTLQSVLNKLTNGTDGFGYGSRTATASIDGGRIRLTDGTKGDSQLTFSISSDNAGGGTLNFGATSTDQVGRLREITAGTDARVRLDGVLVTRPSNTISDALAGVTLNLQQAEVGTTVDLSIARDLDQTVHAVQSFASAYNSVMSYGSAQLSAGPLAANGTLRSSLSSFTKVLLTNVVGLNGTAYNRGALVGVALSKTGTLEVDETKLRSALTTNLNDVKALFATAGSTSITSLQYVTKTDKTKPGSYDVVISRAATAASNTGSGFSGVYADADGTPDTMTITDGATSKSGSVSLADGDTTDVIVEKLNALFQSQGMHLAASKSGNDLKLASTDYGSAPSFTVAYAAGGANDGTAQLGFAAGTYAGLDVQGTIGGNAATGRGQVLTGDAGFDTEGLSVLYTGSTADPLVPAGSISFALGVGGMMAHAVDVSSRAGDGLVAGQLSSIDTSVASLQRRADDVQQRLDRRRQALIQQYAAMEQALSRLQAQGSWLSSQINALSASNK